MQRLYEDAAYSEKVGSYWEETGTGQDWPVLAQDLDVEVAIIGGGFTGLNAALELAKAGRKVTVLEAERPAWGASGRNGGFCCLGGTKAPDSLLKSRFGAKALAEWHSAQNSAVAHVRGLLDSYGIDADTHSDGETQLAHTPGKWAAMQKAAQDDPTLRLTPPDKLRDEGLGGPWYGAATTPVGFALNPMLYHEGLARVAASTGAMLFCRSRVEDLTAGPRWRLRCGGHTVTADQVIIATNGYSSEDLPDWLRARTMPVASRIILTRPLSQAEQEKAGWWSSQMAYDTRKLLHYFRLLPNGRFLFGMRGGLYATPRADAKLAARIRSDFAQAFPAWSNIEITHEWSGLVCLMRALVPFTGAVPGRPGLFASLGYHGNGVSMASYAGKLVAQSMLGHDQVPAIMRKPPHRFPLGMRRRLLMAPAYWAAETLDL